MHIDIKDHYDKIYRYCYFKVKRKELAEDLTQETFLRFLQSSQYREHGKSLNYLYTIAHNLCVDVYRTQKESVIEEKNIETEIQEEFNPFCDPQNAILDQILIKKCLNQLEEKDCELLLLRIVNQVPVQVICDLYEISRFSLYRRMNRITKQLEIFLKEEGFYG